MVYVVLKKIKFNYFSSPKIYHNNYSNNNDNNQFLFIVTDFPHYYIISHTL